MAEILGPEGSKACPQTARVGQDKCHERGAVIIVLITIISIESLFISVKWGAHYPPDSSPSLHSATQLMERPSFAEARAARSNTGRPVKFEFQIDEERCFRIKYVPV